MIPAAYIRAWAKSAPWPRDEQIEQDLILSRLMIEIAQDELLGPELTLRGGTCLNKLHLPSPFRYSEDLDYVRTTRSGIKPYMTKIRQISTKIGLVEQSYKQSEAMVHMTFDTEPTIGEGRIRIKIETNIREIDPYVDRITINYRVASRWWEGDAEINTFVLDELMGTKLRCLYQRKKGRDLFDLDRVLTILDVVDERIVSVLEHYMKDQVFTYPQLATNLAAKLSDTEFREDLRELVLPNVWDAYDIVAAADRVMERLGVYLSNAPRVEEVTGGAWRK